MSASVVLLVVALAAAADIGVLAAPAPAVSNGCQATDIMVTNNLDGSGPPAGSLRAAFAAASGAAGPQTICVANTVVGPITLTTAGGGPLLYNAAMTPGLTIEGDDVTVQAAPAAGIIDDATSGPLQLDHLTISGGDSPNPGAAWTPPVTSPSRTRRSRRTRRRAEEVAAARSLGARYRCDGRR